MSNIDCSEQDGQEALIQVPAQNSVDGVTTSDAGEIRSVGAVVSRPGVAQAGVIVLNLGIAGLLAVSSHQLLIGVVLTLNVVLFVAFLILDVADRKLSQHRRPYQRRFQRTAFTGFSAAAAAFAVVVITILSGSIAGIVLLPLLSAVYAAFSVAGYRMEGRGRAARTAAQTSKLVCERDRSVALARGEVGEDHALLRGASASDAPHGDEGGGHDQAR